MAIAASTIITQAFQNCGVLSAFETLRTEYQTDGLTRLNQLMLWLRAQSLSLPFVSREVFSVVANQATYTYGPSGDFNTTIRPTAITGAGLLLNSSSPPVEIPRGLLTDDGYEAIQMKDLSNQLWTNVYFNPTYAAGLASVTLWPVPNTAQNDCVLYRGDSLPVFSSYSASMDVPPSAEDMLVWNLSKRLLVPYAVTEQTAIQLILDQATDTLMVYKRQNYKLTDLPIDPALARNSRGGYNINTGTGGQVF